MAIWIKPNGMEIEINDEPGNVEAAQKLGWKRKNEAKQAAPPADKNKPEAK